MNKLDFNNDTNSYIFKCPHCEIFIIVARNEFNCKIFRHGCNKITGEQINPHATKQQCEAHLNSGNVVGCCKPFQIIVSNNEYYAISCDYI